MYQMGKDNIKWGNEDHWTHTPHKVAKITDGHLRRPGASSGWRRPRRRRAAGGGGGGGRGGGAPACPQLYAALTAKEHRDPQGYILPSDSPDFGTSVRFVNALIKSGISVHRATASFTVGGKQYPANSLIVKSGQAFRPHVIDMFEPQDHPDDIPYPGATPLPPYDSAGYTLAFQMGVVIRSHPRLVQRAVREADRLCDRAAWRHPRRAERRRLLLLAQVERLVHRGESADRRP